MKNNYHWFAIDQPVSSFQKNVFFSIWEYLMDRLLSKRPWKTIKAEIFGQHTEMTAHGWKKWIYCQYTKPCGRMVTENTAVKSTFSKMESCSALKKLAMGNLHRSHRLSFGTDLPRSQIYRQRSGGLQYRVVDMEVNLITEPPRRVTV